MNDVTLLGLVACLGVRTQVSIKMPKKKKAIAKSAQDWFLELSEDDIKANYVAVKIDIKDKNLIEVEAYYG